MGRQWEDTNINRPPATAAPAARPWAMTLRPGTGTFIMSHAGTLLGRIDQASGTIYLFDKKTKSEVAVLIRDLLPAQIALTIT